jgi:FkbM family methyltransferase
MTPGDMTRTFDGRDWLWPASDRICWRYVHEIRALRKIYRHVMDWSVCVQAGGNMGVWPWNLAQRFARVYTFEADAENFRYLRHNIVGAGPGEIIAEQRALGPWDSCRVTFPPEDPENIGAYYVVENGPVPMRSIDSLRLESCGLIYLDIEGFELEALRSGERTVREFRPVIVTEYKPLPQQQHPERIDPYMLELGYRKGDYVERDQIWLPA